MNTFILIIAFAAHVALGSNVPLEDIGSPFFLGTNMTIISPEDNWQITPRSASTICLAQINQQRANNRLQAVQGNAQVERAAANHNNHMRTNNCFSHQCSGEPALGQRLSNTGYRWNGVGEIIALGHRDCAQVVQGWMNSPGHRAIMLGQFRHVGCSSVASNRGTYWTCVFANSF